MSERGSCDGNPWQDEGKNGKLELFRYIQEEAQKDIRSQAKDESGTTPSGCPTGPADSNACAFAASGLSECQSGGEGVNAEPRIENTTFLADETGMSYKPNFRKCTSTAQRSNGKGSKWLTRVDDQGGYEAPLRMAMADNAALQRKGVKGKGKSGEGKEGKGLGKRSKGKGARLPLTDLVPEPDPEQKFIMMANGIAYYQNILQQLQVDAIKTFQEMNEQQPAGVVMVPMQMQDAREIEMKDNKFTPTDSGDWILQFTVRKASPTTELGMQVSHVRGQPPMKVQKVHMDGVIPSWNKLCLGDFERRAVRPGDEILAVNDATTVQQILQEMKNQTILRFKILRSRSTWNRTDAI